MLGKWKVTPRQEVGSCSASRGSGPKFSSRKRCPRGDRMPLQILWRGSSLRSRTMVSRPASTRRLAAAAAARLAPTITTSTERMRCFPLHRIQIFRQIGKVHHRQIADTLERGAIGQAFDHDARRLAPLQNPCAPRPSSPAPPEWRCAAGRGSCAQPRFGAQAIVVLHQALVVGMIGARLDHVKVGAGDTAAHARPGCSAPRPGSACAHPGSQRRNWRSSRPSPTTMRVAAKACEETRCRAGADHRRRFPAPARCRRRRRRRMARSEQCLHARQQRRIGAQAPRPGSSSVRRDQRAANGRPHRAAAAPHGRFAAASRCRGDSFAAQVHDHAGQIDALRDRPARRRRTACRPRAMRASSAAVAPYCSALARPSAVNRRIAAAAPHRADQQAQAAAAAGAVVARRDGRPVQKSEHQKITSRLRIIAGSARRFMARCRSTRASPNTRRI